MCADPDKLKDQEPEPYRGNRPISEEEVCQLLEDRGYVFPLCKANYPPGHFDDWDWA